MERHVGLDVDSASCTAAALDARGKRLGSHVIETNGQALVEFFGTQAGTLHACMEEGTQIRSPSAPVDAFTDGRVLHQVRATCGALAKTVRSGPWENAQTIECAKQRGIGWQLLPSRRSACGPSLDRSRVVTCARPRRK